MSYKVKTTNEFDKKFKKLDKAAQKLILSYIVDYLEGTDNPYVKGKPLVGNLKGLWRYKIADYRLVVEIKDDELIIFTIDIGHRKEIYRVK